MLCTFVADVYRKYDTASIVTALKETCNAADNVGWSSAGIYCFWHPDTKEILYIGLAVDLAQRFQQHNGLLPCPVNACKIEQITEYFKTNDLLGYSVMLQSSMYQPFNANYFLRFEGEVYPNLEDYQGVDDSARQEISLLEGLLIQAHKNHSKLPKWNKVGGSKQGQAVDYPDASRLLNCFTGNYQDPLLARSSLREIACNGEIYIMEETILHVVRLHMLRLGMHYDKAWESVDDMMDLKIHIREIGYEQRQPNLSGQNPYEDS
jgi:hypothetical protein